MKFPRGNQTWAVLAGLLAAGAASAAEPVVTPGAVGDTLKPGTPLQKPNAAGVLNQAAPAASQIGNSGPTVTVSRFVLSGNRLFDDATLQPLLTPFVNRPITIGELYQAADRVAAFYASRGYVLASVSVPAQSVDSGEVHLEVIEGRVSSIQFAGNRAYRGRVLQHFVRHTEVGDVYRSDHLEDDLETLNALPGLTARAVLEPGSDYGTSDILIRAHEKRFDVLAIGDNYGRKDVGEYRATAAVTLNAPLGFGDRLQVLGAHSGTNRLNYGYVAYSAPLDFSGLRLNVDYGQAEFHVAPPFDAPGRNRNFDAGLEQAFVRTRADTLLGNVGYIRTDANADLAGVSITDTSLNLFSLGGTWTHVWENGAVTQHVLSMHSNFERGSLQNRNRETFRAELDSQHLEPLPAHFEALVHVDTVYTRDPIADTEQLSVGGPTSIRGFAPSEARGDGGFYGQLTLRRPFFFRQVSFVPRVFGDTGIVYRKDLPAGVPNKDSLSSAGAGFDLGYRFVNFKLDWSYPLDSKPTSDGRDDGRVYAALSAAF